MPRPYPTRANADTIASARQALRVRVRLVEQAEEPLERGGVAAAPGLSLRPEGEVHVVPEAQPEIYRRY